MIKTKAEPIINERELRVYLFIFVCICIFFLNARIQENLMQGFICGEGLRTEWMTTGVGVRLFILYCLVLFDFEL